MTCWRGIVYVVRCSLWVYVSICGAGQRVPVAGGKIEELDHREANARRVLVLDHDLYPSGGAVKRQGNR